MKAVSILQTKWCRPRDTEGPWFRVQAASVFLLLLWRKDPSRGKVSTRASGLRGPSALVLVDRHSFIFSMSESHHCSFSVAGKSKLPQAGVVDAMPMSAGSRDGPGASDSESGLSFGDGNKLHKERILLLQQCIHIMSEFPSVWQISENRGMG